MRTKDLILKDSQYTMDNLPRDTGFMFPHERLTLEVLVDIRDMLNERLLEIDRGLHYLHDKIK